jgi:hypothetical protein
MLSHNNKTIILLLITIFINYYTPLPFIGFEFTKRRNFINRLYMSVFIAFIVVLTDIILHKEEFSIIELFIWLLFLTFGIVGSYYLINNQIFVDENDFLLTLKENHEMDIHMTDKIIKNKILDNTGIDYANFIIKNRTNELVYNNNVLNNLKK